MPTPVAIAAIQTGIGIPKNHPEPMKSKLSPNRVIGCPLVRSMMNPLTAVIVPSVATNGGILNLVIINPLNNPIAKPAKTPIIDAPRGLNLSTTPNALSIRPYFKSFAVTAPENPRIEPTDRSIPPVRMTNVIPTAIQRLTAVCLRMIQKFSRVRNRLDRKLNKTIRPRSMKID